MAQAFLFPRICFTFSTRRYIVKRYLGVEKLVVSTGSPTEATLPQLPAPRCSQQWGWAWIPSRHTHKHAYAVHMHIRLHKWLHRSALKTAPTCWSCSPRWQFGIEVWDICVLVYAYVCVCVYTCIYIGIHKPSVELSGIWCQSTVAGPGSLPDPPLLWRLDMQSPKSPLLRKIVGNGV